MDTGIGLTVLDSRGVSRSVIFHWKKIMSRSYRTRRIAVRRGDGSEHAVRSVRVTGVYCRCPMVSGIWRSPQRVSVIQREMAVRSVSSSVNISNCSS